MKNEIEIYIKGFRTIYNESKISIDGNLNIILGPNGIGKTNILESIVWFQNSNDIKIEEIETQFKKSDFMKGPKINTSVAICKKVDNNFHQKIIKELSIEKNEELNNLDLNKQKIINIKNDNTTGILRFDNLSWVEFSEENYMLKILKIYQKHIIDNNGGKIDTSFIENDTFKESLLNKIIQNLEQRSPKTENDNILLNIYQEISKKYNFIKDMAQIKLDICYIENANKENKVKYYYNINDFIAEDFKHHNDLINLLSVNVDIRSKFKELQRILDENNNQNNNKITSLQNEIYEDINEECNLYITELFSSFDLYAIPKIKFYSDKITISVEPKDDIQIQHKSTEFNSAGYKAFFELILKIESYKIESLNFSNYLHIILADEPDKNLHPYLQSQLSNYFNQEVKKIKNLYLLITTHSPFFMLSNEFNYYIVDRIDNDNIVYFNKKDLLTGSTIIEKYEKNKRYRIQNNFSLLIASKLAKDENYEDYLKMTRRHKVYFFSNETNSDEILTKVNSIKNIDVINLNKIIDSTKPEQVKEILKNILYYSLKDFKNNNTKEKIIKEIERGYNIIISK